MARFHARVTTYSYGTGYLLDLDEVAVVSDLLLPIYNNDMVVLEGKRAPMKDLDRCKIVLTGDFVQPRLKEWYERQTIRVGNPKEQFFDSTKFFDLECDVSNALLQELKRSMELERIRELLAQERDLKQQFAEQPVAPQATEVKTALSETARQIAVIIGAFVGEATGRFVNAQKIECCVPGCLTSRIWDSSRTSATKR
jgi:hypothetical protein